jgi:hypothetical protein
MNARRLAGLFLLTLLALCCAASAADARVQHASLEALTKKISEGVPSESGAAVTGVLQGVDSVTDDEGHLWISDSFEGLGIRRADSFDDTTGVWQQQLEQVASLREPMDRGLAIGHSTGEVQIYLGADFSEHEGGTVAVFGGAGEFLGDWIGGDTPEGTFGGSGGFVETVTVDESGSLGDWASGDVYIAVTGGNGSNAIDVLKPEANGGEKYVTQLTSTEPTPGEMIPLGRVRAMTIDRSNGDLIVATNGESPAVTISVLAPVTGVEGSYELVSTLTQPPGADFESEISGMAFDSATRELYVSTSRQGVFEYSLEAGDKNSTFLGHMAGIGSEEFGVVRGVAVSEVTHDVFVANFSENEQATTVDALGPGVVVPDVVTQPASDITPTSATLHGTVDPDEAGQAKCAFAWDTSAKLENSAACAAPVPDGNSPVAVQTQLSGLLPDTTYVFRLQAENANGSNQGETSQNLEFTTSGPGIRSVWSSDVTTESATLNASVDPHGAPTSYYFEVGKTTAYELPPIPPPPGASAGSGEGTVAAAPQHLQGLDAGAVYHYRLVVTSEPEAGVTETFFSGDTTFETSIATTLQLPDGRQWEMVSPPDKHGSLVEPIGQEGLIQASAAGGALSYFADAPIGSEPAGYANESQVYAARTSAGWQSRDIAIPHPSATGKSEGVGEDYRFFSEDLSQAIVQPAGSFIPASSPQALAPSEASEQTSFLRTNYIGGDPSSFCTGSCFRPLVTGKEGIANVPPGTEFGEEGVCPVLEAACGPKFQAASPDAKHVILFSNVQLTGTPASEGGLYEWTEGHLTLVSILPSEEGGGAAPHPDIGIKTLGARYAISDDGSMVYWSASNRLYVRDLPLNETVRLDTVASGAGGGPVAPAFQLASADGQRVYFSDTQRLTSGSGARSFTPDLYTCSLTVVAGKLTCPITDVTPKVGNHEGRLIGNVMGASENAEVVYFVANGVLAAGASQGDCGEPSSPAGTECNVYVEDHGVTRFVSRVAGPDGPDWAFANTVPQLSFLTTRVSPDGRYLTFMSSLSLTGYDNSDEASGEPDEEVYLYDDASHRVTCASCNPTGSRPHGMRFAKGVRHVVDRVPIWSGWLAANVPGWTPYQNGNARYQSRYLDNDGRLFFNSSDDLVPQDKNGTWDVYEYEPNGVGSCTSASTGFSSATGGCVTLLSSGASEDESAFIDASENGSDVYFLTTSKLLGADFDHSYDIYDAHECTTSSPCISESTVVSPEPCTSNDSCQGAAAAQPEVFGAPASAFPKGVGNLSVQPQPKAKATTRTRAQLLVKALAACRHKANKRKRGACEAQARKRYGPKKKAAPKEHKAPAKHANSTGRKG